MCVCGGPRLECFAAWPGHTGCLVAKVRSRRPCSCSCSSLFVRSSSFFVETDCLCNAHILFLACTLRLLSGSSPPFFPRMCVSQSFCFFFVIVAPPRLILYLPLWPHVMCCCVCSSPTVRLHVPFHFCLWVLKDKDLPTQKKNNKSNRFPFSFSSIPVGSGWGWAIDTICGERVGLQLFLEHLLANGIQAHRQEDVVVANALCGGIQRKSGGFRSHEKMRGSTERREQLRHVDLHRAQFERLAVETPNKVRNRQHPRDGET